MGPANNDVEVGIEMVKRYFQTGFDGEPRLQVFSTCRNWLKERGNYRRKTKVTFGRERDATRAVPVKKYDHLMDATRYCIVGGFERDMTIERDMDDEYSSPLYRTGHGPPNQQRVNMSWRRLMRQMKDEERPPLNPYLGDQY